ncbi:MAG: carbamoyltransferase C-terminal domain-containing protein [Pseudomonadota bacterium]
MATPKSFDFEHNGCEGYVKISIVTACYNSAGTIRDALDSVAAQRHQAVEHVIVDGASTDGTWALVQAYRSARVASVSEPDSGIYDALNKGIRRSSGDVIGFLHADDVFADAEVLTRLADEFGDSAADVVYGDLQYVGKNDVTQFIGFPNYGDEYKVMGLAPYGKPAFMGQMRQIVLTRTDGAYALNLSRHHKEKIEYEWAGGSPVVGDLFNDELARLLGVPRRSKDQPLEQVHRDIAHSVQAMYEEAFFNLLAVTHAKHGIDNLTLAGGCGMNSVANGKVYRRSPYKHLYVQSAAGDAGGAIGCAYVVASELGLTKMRFHMDHAYWGPSYGNDYHADLLERRKSDLDSADCTVQFIDDEAELCNQTADAIAEGLVIGWFQGRMEWGPRALGNRSILGDPQRADMKDVLNLKIQRRESFRPFAPSILREKVIDWFEEEDEVPFMMQVFQIRENKRSEIPAVTHVDGSGRLQTVNSATNPRYHRLISTFCEKTGVPIVLNTSFNENEPVVCKPEEALDCFLRTKMDVLVLGDYLVRRRGFE